MLKRHGTNFKKFRRDGYSKVFLVGLVSDAMPADGGCCQLHVGKDDFIKNAICKVVSENGGLSVH